MPLTIKASVEKLHQTFLSGKTRSAQWRKSQLKQLMRMIDENNSLWKNAFEKDLGHKGEFYADVVELETVRNEIKIALSELDEWMKDRPVKTPLLMQPASSFVRPEPVGVVTIIAPWNYPVSLCLVPLVASISAGNCSVVKPSEVTPNCSRALADLLERYLDNEAIAVVEGGVEETTELLKQRVDHIFYTGNGTVGKIVMRAAAEHLSGVTLELGGKSPTFVLEDADIEVAAKRILWGKFTNCGQTCVAPDYVLVQKKVHDQFVDALSRNLREFYGENPKESRDYSRIVNRRHCERLEKTIKETVTHGAHLVTGGQTDPQQNYVAPTIFSKIDFSSPIMKEENFGPLLPVISIDSVEDALHYINSHDHPLALYVFSASKQAADHIFQNTRAGGSCLNDTVVQVGNPYLPFGGTGPSGTGQYHGRFGFDNLSHFRAILSKGTFPDLAVRYPPYTDSKIRTINLLRSLRPSTGVMLATGVVLLGLGGYAFISVGGTEFLRSTAVSGLTSLLNYLK